MCRSILWVSEGIFSTSHVTNSAKHPKVYRIAMLSFGCVLFVYLFVQLGATEISSHVVRVGWYFALITVIYLGYQLIRASAYWECIADHKHVSYWDVVRIRLSGEAIQFITSSGPFWPSLQSVASAETGP